jgi:hypothetical protein
MSTVQTAFEPRDREKSTRAGWLFAAKVLFALALVFATTFALVRTEFLLGAPASLISADFPVMPE